MDCLKRKQKKKEQKKAHPISPHASQAHSPSSSLGPMGNVGNGSLPKVSSTGLWMDTPSVFAVNPSPFYYYDRPVGSMQRIDHPYLLPRAVSESRLHPAGLSYLPPGPQFGSKNSLYFMPVPGQRFYHSQQMAPGYQVPSPRGMEIYDYHPYMGGNGVSRSRLLETRHSPYYYSENSQFIMKPRVERRKSDAENKRPVKLEKKKESSKRISMPPHENGIHHVPKDKKSSQQLFVDDKKKLLNSLEHSQGSGGSKGKPDYTSHAAHINGAFSPDSLMRNGTTMPPNFLGTSAAAVSHPTLLNGTAVLDIASVSSSENISPSATDSMKLLANNRTDDQKTHPPFINVKLDNSNFKIDDDVKEFNVRHYTYQGEIYTSAKKDNYENGYDNPIINRMKEMVIERSRLSNSSVSSNDLHNSYQITNSSNDVTSTEDPAMHSDITHVARTITTKVTESHKSFDNPGRNLTQHQTSNSRDIVNSLVLPDNLNLDDDKHLSQQLNSFLSFEANRKRNELFDSSNYQPGQEVNSFPPIEADRNELVDSKSLKVGREINSFLSNEADRKINDLVDSSGLHTGREINPLSSTETDRKRNELAGSSNNQAGREKDISSPTFSFDTDAGTDDLNIAGNQITTTAFQFLDTYLSDDEGTDSHIESPPLSPGGMRAV